MSPSRKRAALNQNRRHRAAALVELGFDHDARSLAVGIGLEIEHFGLQQNGIEQLVEIGALQRRDFDIERVAAHAFDDDLMLQQFGAHPVGIGRLLVDLVDRHDDRHFGRARVIDRFDRLRHHAVIGGNHQHDDIGRLGAARAHGGEGFVARRIDEGDEAVRRRNLIGADMLGDAAGFARHDIGLADGVEQRGLAVVDMAHDGDDRRARLQLLGGIGVARQAFDHVRFRHALDAVAHFLGDDLRRVGIDHVVDRVHLPLLHQELDDVDGAFGHAVGEFLDGDRFRNDDFARHLLGRHLEALRLLLQAFGAAAEGGNRAVALIVFGQGIDNGELAAALVGLGLGARRSRRLTLQLDDA